MILTVTHTLEKDFTNTLALQIKLTHNGNQDLKKTQ